MIPQGNIVGASKSGGVSVPSTNTLLAGNGSGGVVAVPTTSTASGTNGAQTINKPAGSVNFAAAAVSLVVTNSLATANSIILATVNTADVSMQSVQAVGGAGTITLFPNNPPTSATRVSFLVIN